MYDASLKSTKNSASLNDCLEMGFPLQNSICDILVSSGFETIFLCGETEKAFLQIRTLKCDRNILLFHSVQKNVIRIAWKEAGFLD